MIDPKIAELAFCQMDQETAAAFLRIREALPEGRLDLNSVDPEDVRRLMDYLEHTLKRNA